tara:strand:+ start:306 stop:815 length:510 start_codon:yes stop_codon:yes gene_type:complete
MSNFLPLTQEKAMAYGYPQDRMGWFRKILLAHYGDNFGFKLLKSSKLAGKVSHYDSIWPQYAILNPSHIYLVKALGYRREIFKGYTPVQKNEIAEDRLATPLRGFYFNLVKGEKSNTFKFDTKALVAQVEGISWTSQGLDVKNYELVGILKYNAKNEFMNWTKNPLEVK